MTGDHYRLLQVDPEAEPEVIAAAYRALAKKYHPDRDPSRTAVRRMQAINEAWEVLGDPERRRRYDEAQAVGTTGPGGAAADDPFADLWGEPRPPGAARGRRRPGADPAAGEHREGGRGPGAWLDGCFWAELPGTLHLVRFYDDGLVIVRTLPARPATLRRLPRPSRWRGGSFTASGSYLVLGRRLDFTVSAPAGPVQYSGSAHKKRLVLDIHELVADERHDKVEFLAY